MFFILTRVLRLLGCLVIGLFLVTFTFPALPERRRLALVRWWAKRILRIFSIRLHVQHPERLPPGGALLVMNHISWIDIYVLQAFQPAYFIAKADIASWPLIGYLCARAGTVFIERGKRHAVRAVNERVKHLLQQGAQVACFPEGTTTNGSYLLPFHANLLQAPLDVQAPLVPIALRYFDSAGKLAQAVDYSGNITLRQSMWAIWRAARLGGITAQLEVLPPCASVGARHELAQAAQQAIAQATGLTVQVSR